MHRRPAILIGILSLVLACACGARPVPTSAAPAATPQDHRARARALDDAFNAHDTAAIAALYASDAVVHVWGLADDRGRPAIEGSAGEIFAAFPDARRTTGRMWIKDAHTALVEWTLAGTNTGTSAALSIGAATGKHAGIVAASVLVAGDDGRIREERRYIDFVTLVGQLVPPDPENPLRPVIASPPSGTGVFEASGAPAEAAQLDGQRQYVAALDGHHIDDVMKTIAPDFQSDDYLAPATVGATELRASLTFFITSAQDFRATVASAFATADYGIFEMEFDGTFPDTKEPGKPHGTFHVHELQVNHFEAGRMQRSWSWSDGLETAHQLGLPAPHVPAG